jgi:hypothetical protein
MIGKQLSNLLVDIEQRLWEFEFDTPDQPEYTDEAFRAVCKIFMSALMDKMWDLQEKEGLEIEDRVTMAVSAGNDINKLVKMYTDLDTFKMYERN